MATSKPFRKVNIRDMELVVKPSIIRDPKLAGLGDDLSWKQTYSGGAGTPRDHTDLDCED